MSRGPEPAGRSGIGSSNSRFQPRSVTGLDRLPQPLHGEFDILRLQVAPALELGLVPLVREALVIFPNCLPGGRALLCELLADTARKAMTKGRSGTTPNRQLCFYLGAWRIQVARRAPVAHCKLFCGYVGH